MANALQPITEAGEDNPLLPSMLFLVQDRESTPLVNQKPSGQFRGMQLVRYCFWCWPSFELLRFRQDEKKLFVPTRVEAFRVPGKLSCGS